MHFSHVHAYNVPRQFHPAYFDYHKNIQTVQWITKLLDKLLSPTHPYFWIPGISVDIVT
jgi:hypothetical protein